ncbi:unnamed protein product [Rotaria sordida]|uniref:Uncharacterized protein n=1 Tax=Rotaria sordida TaxID=392033 RepID=A0A813Z5K3_9BILA|nr:unnamed protein product [Rotaria sordida]
MGVILSSTLATSMPLFREKIMNMVYWLFIIGAVEFLAGLLEGFIWNISAKRQTLRMRVSLFRSILQRSIPYMDAKSASQLNAKLFDNIEKIEKGIGFEFLILMSTLPCIIGCLIVSFIVNWQLTLIMLCLIPLVIGSSFMFSQLTAKEAMNELMIYSKAGQIVQEVFSSLRTILSLNGNKFEQKRYDRELYPTRWSSIRKGAVFGIYTGWLSLMTYLVYSVGFIFGSLLMSHKADHTLDISDILAIVTLFAQCLKYFSSIGPFFQSFSEARGAAASVFRLIDEGNDASINEIDVWKEDTEAIDNINGDIEFDNIIFSYPSRKDVPVLRNLSLIARAGQITALVGSSGCGKSTCISLFLRYYEPSSGQIMIDGRPITDYNVKQLRQNIGVVSQEPILFGMSTYENIRFGKVNATQAEIEQAAQEANAHNFIMQLPDKYETLVGERGIQLSGGEKQRIALARALVKQPSFLLLDEATSALDNVNEKIVQETLDRACKGRTTIVIAHRLATIRNAHQIYVLDDGSVIEQGTHEILMAKKGGKYQAMVKHQQMEKIDDNIDDMMSMQKVQEEDEKWIFERSRLLSDSGIVDVNKLLDGIDIRKLNIHWIRSHFGLVSQEPILFDLTIAENIAYGLENVPMEDIINAARKANIHQFIQKLPQGYETKVGWKGSFLSGGEKQRIAIARTLLRQPKVLLLDEATSAMDSHNEQIVQEALEKAQREDPSRTSLIIAHRLSTICSCDLICVLDRGHIVESGTHKELIERRGAYYKMLAKNNLQ